MCRENGIDCEYLELPGENHFSMAAILGEPKSALVRVLLEQMGLDSS